jgi:hypothetical protein
VTATPTFKRFLTTVSTFNPQQKRPSTYTLQRVLSLICGVIAVISFKARAPFFVLAVILTRQIENVNRAQQKKRDGACSFFGFFRVFSSFLFTFFVWRGIIKKIAAWRFCYATENL